MDWMYSLPMNSWRLNALCTASLRMRPYTWEFFEAFWANDAAGLARMLERMLDENEGMYEACGMFLHYFLYWLFDVCGNGYVVQWGDIGRTEADVVVYNKEDRRIAAIKAMRAGSEEELPALAEKAFRQLKDNTECDLVNRNGDVWSVTFWGMAFYQKHCVFMAG